MESNRWGFELKLWSTIKFKFILNHPSLMYSDVHSMMNGDIHTIENIQALCIFDVVVVVLLKTRWHLEGAKRQVWRD